MLTQGFTVERPAQKGRDESSFSTSRHPLYNPFLMDIVFRSRVRTHMQDPPPSLPHIHTGSTVDMETTCPLAQSILFMKMFSCEGRRTPGYCEIGFSLGLGGLLNCQAVLIKSEPNPFLSTFPFLLGPEMPNVKSFMHCLKRSTKIVLSDSAKQDGSLITASY